MPSSPPRPWPGAPSSATSTSPRTASCAPRSSRASTASTSSATSRTQRVRGAVRPPGARSWRPVTRRTRCSGDRRPEQHRRAHEPAPPLVQRRLLRQHLRPAELCARVARGEPLAATAHPAHHPVHLLRLHVRTAAAVVGVGAGVMVGVARWRVRAWLCALRRRGGTAAVACCCEQGEGMVVEACYGERGTARRALHPVMPCSLRRGAWGHHSLGCCGACAPFHWRWRRERGHDCGSALRAKWGHGCGGVLRRAGGCTLPSAAMGRVWAPFPWAAAEGLVEALLRGEWVLGCGAREVCTPPLGCGRGGVYDPPLGRP